MGGQEVAGLAAFVGGGEGEAVVGAAVARMLEQRHHAWSLMVADAASGAARLLWKAPPTLRGSPMSPALSPPYVIPPRCRPGSTSTTRFPIRAACTAATTPPDVPPYKQTSASTPSRTQSSVTRANVSRPVR